MPEATVARPGGLEKAAILLLTLGPEAAAAVFRHLSEPEVRQVSAAIARLRSIPREHAAAVHEEAWRRLTQREGLLVDGEQFARQMIAAAASGARAPDTARRAREAGGEFLASSLEPVAPAALAQVLGNEHPQVIALVLANLRPRKAAQVLAALPEPLQPEVVQRIADLQSVPDDLLAEVSDVLAGQVQGLGRVSQTPAVLGAKLVAEIMNVVDAAVETRILAHLESDAPEVAETIRALMFTFEDLVRLDDRGMQTLLKEVARDELILALKTASPAMREKVFKNLSHRAAEILQEDMSAMGAVRLKDVERAQAGIVALARRLDAEQRITLGVREDDVVV
jgi:flagellar motor switch protein FliG